MSAQKTVLNYKTLDKYLTWIALTSAVIAFTWSYVATKDVTRSLILPGKVVLPMFVVLKLWLNRKSQIKGSGLTEEEFVVSEAGGVAGLLKVVKLLRQLGWFFVSVPSILAGVLWIAKSQMAGVVGIISGLAFIPLGFSLLYLAGVRKKAADKMAKLPNRNLRS